MMYYDFLPYVLVHLMDFVEWASVFEHDYPIEQFVQNMYHPKSNLDEIWQNMLTLRHFDNGKHLQVFAF